MGPTFFRCKAPAFRTGCHRSVGPASGLGMQPLPSRGSGLGASRGPYVLSAHEPFGVGTRALPSSGVASGSAPYCGTCIGWVPFHLFSAFASTLELNRTLAIVERQLTKAREALWRLRVRCQDRNNYAVWLASAEDREREMFD
ncbi:hypothetical protein MRB53_028736 [Persea americana]|uniref:Uncharacterized protein n=1 Tax=Persea americana TaxID=3435 RepID=A0ACC2KGU7_PERAE|nr:hypothetical protein MRB53_028736 [Persea americana]